MNPSTRSLLTTVSLYWKGFDLDSKRAQLDAQGVSMQEQKEASLKSRKALADLTKRFRKLNDSEKAAGLPPLLKAYQEEIDTLTKRAKFSDNAFFALYKALYEAPDPVPALDAALEASTTAVTAGNSDIDALRKEIQAYEVEFATLKNQDITIRNLENKIASFEETLESMVEDKVNDRCRDLEYTAAMRENELAAMQTHLTKSMHQARQERDDALANLDRLRSELLHAKQRNDHLLQSHAKEAEAWLLEADRVRALQLENQRLKDKLTSTEPSATDAFESQKAMEWELSLAQKDAHIAQLSRDLLAARALVEPAEAALADVRADRDALEREAAALRLRPTVEAFEDLAAQLTASPPPPDAALVALQEEQARVVVALEATVASQRATIETHVATIRALEDAVDAPTETPPLLQGVLAPADDLKLLAIIRAQRDRLRDRVKESERDAHAEREKMQHVANRLAQLEAENVDLVQKLRFLSNAGGDLEANVAPPSKYARLYEERMSPFAQFKHLESQQRYAKLNPVDKLLLPVARMVLSHPATRLGLIAYLLFLHTLVALTIYTFMHLCNVSNHS
ncbi:CASP-like isoform X1 [Achlya hypogyna]|uniref:Protein CASP n=1 Tax=Achlya hypogyna TaxID=1202772 RepID=A0A1V9YM50_ACHHY|nr:CASP-like isoform X1 [Achlya hypogyna]